MGEKGRREEIAEWRLEIVCPEPIVTRVVSAMRAAHSYEEPAYDVYSLRPARTHGAGRVGQLSTAMPLSELAARVRSVLRSGPVQVVGELTKSIRRVALACGAAGELPRTPVEPGQTHSCPAKCGFTITWLRGRMASR